ncbi:MAG: TlyA family RNA methyltransferase [Christensenellales bacterium]
MARLDVYLVSCGLAKTRSKAKQLIDGGLVFVNGVKAVKAGFDVGGNDKIEIKGEINPFVSKGGLKLKKAVDCFGLDFKGKVIVDIGSSTGGFTDCALKEGAKKVYAVDVGHSQLDDGLRLSDKVVSMEDTDFRTLDVELIGDVDIAVADVSFISILKLVDKLKEFSGLEYLILLIKPQFECGLQVAKKYKGVIKDKEIHKSIIRNILQSFKNCNFVCTNLTFSAITGGDGNIEYIAKFINANHNCNNYNALNVNESNLFNENASMNDNNANFNGNESANDGNANFNENVNQNANENNLFFESAICDSVTNDKSNVFDANENADLTNTNIVKMDNELLNQNNTINESHKIYENQYFEVQSTIGKIVDDAFIYFNLQICVKMLFGFAVFMV